MNAFLSEEILEWLTSPHKTEIDALLAAALDDYESGAGSERSEAEKNGSSPLPGAPLPTSSSSLSSCTEPAVNLPPISRFAKPKTEQEILQARAQGVPNKTIQDTKYCVRVWEAWRDHRNHNNPYKYLTNN